MASQGLTIAGRRRPAFPIGRIVLWILLILVILSILVPFYWVLRTALSTKVDLYANPAQISPPGFTFDNFRRVLGQVTAEEALAAGGSGQALNFFLYLRNSVIVTVLLVGGQ